jgi:hypothetical protein
VDLRGNDSFWVARWFERRRRPVISSTTFLSVEFTAMADETLSDEELDEIYRGMVDSFIDQANELAETNSAENVGMAILYAASRFNAHVVSQHSETPESYEKELPRAREFFCNQYQTMLDENLEDYKSVFSKYANFMRRQ